MKSCVAWESTVYYCNLQKIVKGKNRLEIRKGWLCSRMRESGIDVWYGSSCKQSALWWHKPPIALLLLYNSWTCEQSNLKEISCVFLIVHFDATTRSYIHPLPPKIVLITLIIMPGSEYGLPVGRLRETGTTICALISCSVTVGLHLNLNQTQNMEW